MAHDVRFSIPPRGLGKAGGILREEAWLHAGNVEDFQRVLGSVPYQYDLWLQDGVGQV